MITRINPPDPGTPPGYSQIVEVKSGRIRCFGISRHQPQSLPEHMIATDRRANLSAAWRQMSAARSAQAAMTMHLARAAMPGIT
jgi:hypothetical protein